MSARRRCRVTSADIPGLLRTLSAANVSLSDIETDGRLTVSFTVPVLSAGLVRKTCKKRGEQVRFSRYGGFAFALWDLRKRPVFLLTVFLLLGLTWLLPSRVLFVEVEGNSRVESRAILEQAAQCGIGFWASRWEVRSEKTKNALLEALPELQWAGVNTRGCVAVISVRERPEEAQVDRPGTVSAVTAVRDGIIERVTVTNGTALCRPGQAVRAGETLISGYTDCGRTIRAGRAEGEVYALTERILTVRAAENVLHLEPEGAGKQKIFLRIGKNRIKIYESSGIFPTGCVKMIEEKIWTLPGGFSLPAAWIVERYIPCRERTEPTDSTELLQSFARSYLTDTMVAGEICSAEETVSGSCLYGVYRCREMIGRVTNEEIIESNGKNH